jgi:hypothetical protein
VIDDTVSKLQAVLTAENAPSVVTSLAEYRAQCERISARFQEFAISNPRAIRLLLLEATSIDPQMTQRVLSLIDMGGAFTATYLKNGVERGFFRADLDVEQTGHAITGLIMSGILRYLSAPDNLDALARYGDAVIDLLVAGMAAQG